MVEWGNTHTSTNKQWLTVLHIGIKTITQTRQEIIDAVNVFRNKIIDYTPQSLCIELTGEASKIEAFIELMKNYGIIEMCRTGLVALDRGTKSLGNS